MGERRQRHTEKPSSILVVFSCLLILLCAPYLSTESMGEGNLLLFSLRLALGGAAAGWLFYKVGWVLGSLSAFPVLLLAVYLADGAFVLALASLLYLPLGITLALISKDKLSRATAVAIAAGTATVLFLFLLLLQTYVGQGSMAFSAIEAQYAPFFTLLKENLKKSFVISIIGDNISFVTEENVGIYAKQITAMIPSFLGLATILIGYVAAWLYRLFLQLNREPLPDATRWMINPSPISAILVLLALLVYWLGETFPLYCQIGLISPGVFLLPEFCLAGVSSAFTVRLANGLPRPRILRPILLFLGLLSGFSGLIFISAAFGIFDSIKGLFPHKT